MNQRQKLKYFLFRLIKSLYKIVSQIVNMKKNSSFSLNLVSNLADLWDISFCIFMYGMSIRYIQQFEQVQHKQPISHVQIGVSNKIQGRKLQEEVYGGIKRN